MSLTSTIPPTSTLPSSRPLPTSPSLSKDIPFQHQPAYISLSRQLTRYQHVVLLQPPSASLSPFQQQTQSDLYSVLPYHRTKWLHNIEYCRTLLLQLENAAQSIKIQGQKRAAVHELAEKRMVIKRLRRRIEDIGREVESSSNGSLDPRDEGGETLEQILGRPPLGGPSAESQTDPSQLRNADLLEEGRTVHIVESETPTTSSPSTGASNDREHLLGSSRRRRGHGQPNDPQATTSGFSNLSGTEDTLRAHDRTHDTLTSSLVTLASQLKSQSLTFQSTLATTDQNYLDKALAGLDRNITSMASASKNMQFLRRMSEGQGWWGRMKLYAMIFGLWTFAVLLVFVGPKFRF